MIAVETVHRLGQVLRQFNRQTYQLVLGGQAVTKDILKKINVANLSFCAQTLGLIATLLPLLQSRLQAQRRAYINAHRGGKNLRERDESQSAPPPRGWPT